MKNTTIPGVMFTKDGKYMYGKYQANVRDGKDFPDPWYDIFGRVSPAVDADIKMKQEDFDVAVMRYRTDAPGVPEHPPPLFLGSASDALDTVINENDGNEILQMPRGFLGRRIAVQPGGVLVLPYDAYDEDLQQSKVTCSTQTYRNHDILCPCVNISGDTDHTSGSVVAVAADSEYSEDSMELIALIPSDSVNEQQLAVMTSDDDRKAPVNQNYGLDRTVAQAANNEAQQGDGDNETEFHVARIKDSDSCAGDDWNDPACYAISIEGLSDEVEVSKGDTLQLMTGFDSMPKLVYACRDVDGDMIDASGNKYSRVAVTTGDDGNGAFTSYTQISTSNVPCDNIYGLHLKDGLAYVKATVKLKTAPEPHMWPFGLAITLAVLLFAITGCVVSQSVTELAVSIVFVVLGLAPVTVGAMYDMNII
jgi:hypothetical protein